MFQQSLILPYLIKVTIYCESTLTLIISFAAYSWIVVWLGFRVAIGLRFLRIRRFAEELCRFLGQLYLSDLFRVNVGDLRVDGYGIVVGDSGNDGNLILRNGSTLSVIDGMLVGKGNVVVNGAESNMAVSRVFDIGLGGNSDIRVENGGRLSSLETNLRNGAAVEGQTVTALVDGDGSTWTTGRFVLGQEPANFSTLAIRNGGRVTSTSAIFGSGSLSIEGVGSVWDIDGDLDSLGMSQSILGGGRLISKTSRIAGEDIQTVKGVGSQWINENLSLGVANLSSVRGGNARVLEGARLQVGDDQADTDAQFVISDFGVNGDFLILSAGSLSNDGDAVIGLSKGSRGLAKVYLSVDSCGFTKCWVKINQFDNLLTLPIGFRFIRNVNQKWNTNIDVIVCLFAPTSVLAQLPSMVAPDNDDCIFVQAKISKPFHQFSNAGVNKTDRCVVAVFQSPGFLFIQAFSRRMFDMLQIVTTL